MNPDLGQRYKQRRDDRRWSRKYVSDQTGISEGKLHRIEKQGIFKNDERALLDALYGDDASDTQATQETPEEPDAGVREAREAYMRLYALIEGQQQATAHAEATAGFPLAETFEASWEQATPEQRQHAVTTMEAAVRNFLGVSPPGTHVDPPPPASEEAPARESDDDSPATADAGLERVGPPPKHRDPTGIGFLISDDGRAWRHNGDTWEREIRSDVVQLKKPEEQPGERVAYLEWGDLRQGSRVRLEGESGTGVFQSYVIPPNSGPAYVNLTLSGKQRTVAPERVLKNDHSPVTERAYATAVDDDGRIHAAPFSHRSTLGPKPEEGMPVKLRCGAIGYASWEQQWEPRRLEPALCTRCIELTNPFTGGVVQS